MAIVIRRLYTPGMNTKAKIESFIDLIVIRDHSIYQPKGMYSMSRRQSIFTRDVTVQLNQ